MGYVFTCDGPCGERKEYYPPFAGEFSEDFLTGRGGAFAQHFDVGQKVTICAECMAEVVL